MKEGRRKEAADDVATTAGKEGRKNGKKEDEGRRKTRKRKAGSRDTRMRKEGRREEARKEGRTEGGMTE